MSRVSSPQHTNAALRSSSADDPAALVDSSVGGKTAVNHPRGKNLIGAFYQPRCVIADIGTLETLRGELKAGLAEVIKYGIIHDALSSIGWALTSNACCASTTRRLSMR